VVVDELLAIGNLLLMDCEPESGKIVSSGSELFVERLTPGYGSVSKNGVNQVSIRLRNTFTPHIADVVKQLRPSYVKRSWDNFHGDIIP
jgi:hypothetical protein